MRHRKKCQFWKAVEKRFKDSRYKKLQTPELPETDSERLNKQKTTTSADKLNAREFAFTLQEQHGLFLTAR
ncbi:MAG TPA: hypothetical protein DEF07_00190 [Nitrosomonas sp.]|nr:hypothetical protein [Nitrosomonas sp.]